jgi:predicted ArsR family transcriptional regulator
VQILAELESSDEPLDASELATLLGLHPNTVRWHLGILGDAGLVTSHAAPRHAPGRPRIVFRPNVQAGGETGDEHRLLANILADLVARSAEHSEACETAGRVWGRRLAAGQGSGPEATGDHAVDQLVGLLDQQGFAPTLAGGGLEMHRCPLFDVAETHPDVVCAVHLGLLRGTLVELDAPVTVASLDAFARPGVCVARLAPAAQAE